MLWLSEEILRERSPIQSGCQFTQKRLISTGCSVSQSRIKRGSTLSTLPFDNKLGNSKPLRLGRACIRVTVSGNAITRVNSPHD